MENLTRQQLIDYFKDVFELEKQVYTYERVFKEYGQTILDKCVRKELDIEYMEGGRLVDSQQIQEHFVPVISGWQIERTPKPEWRQTEEFREIMKTKKVVKFKHFMRLLKTTIIFALAILFLGLFLFGTNAIPRLCIFGIIPYGICMFMTTISTSYVNDSLILSNKLRDYYVKCAENESEMIFQSTLPLLNHLESERKELAIKPKEEVLSLLDKLYSKNIIFPKYRNFAAVAQIYEYLVSGRCTELEGPNGAYNLYESELRQNIIIDELDTIIGQLESLNRTMSTMCNAIQTTNRLLGDISMTLGRIEANTALTAYNTQCVAHNTRIASQYVL